MHNKLVTPRDREAMLEALCLRDKACVEVGVLDGAFSSAILAQDPKALFLVDPWTSQDDSLYPRDHNNRSTQDFDLTFSMVLQRFHGDKRVKVIRDYSYFAAQMFLDNSLDFVYVDAIHTLESCLTDIAAWFPKVKDGGWLCGHDFTGKYLGVRMAVEAFCNISGQKISLLTQEPWASWGIKKNMAERPMPSMGYKLGDNRTAVVTLAIGEHFENLGRTTHPTMRLYAERIGADFVVINRSAGHSSGHYEKFQLYDVLGAYDRVIYFDSDVIVRKDCPNLFDVVPREKIGAYDEYSMGTEEEKRVHERVMKEACEMYGQDFFSGPLPAPFFNTGVLVLSKEHRDVLRIPKKELTFQDHYWEQPLINIRLAEVFLSKNVEIQDIGYKFNRMYYVDDRVNEPATDSYIIHYAGRGVASKGLAEKDLATWAKNGLL